VLTQLTAIEPNATMNLHGIHYYCCYCHYYNHHHRRAPTTTAITVTTTTTTTAATTIEQGEKVIEKEVIFDKTRPYEMCRFCC
jgi:hypothetical protein